MIHEHTLSSVPEDKHEAFLKSESTTTVEINHPEKLKPVLLQMQKEYDPSYEEEVTKSVQNLSNVLCECLGSKPCEIELMSEIPYDDYGPLHAYYLPKDPKWPAQIILCLRRIDSDDKVEFEHLLEIFIHEFVHHLDFALYDFGDSFHTKGFDKRQNYLKKELMTILNE